jgi:fumarylpyruvate hydrolase
VAGTERRFSVRRIFCVGRNCADHAREIGNDPTREPPFFCTTPADTIGTIKLTIARR